MALSKVFFCSAHFVVFLDGIGEFPSFFLVNLIERFTCNGTFDFLLISPSEFLEGLVLVPDAFTDFCSRGGTLDVNSVQIPGKRFVESDPVFIRVAFRRVENTVFLYFIGIDLFLVDSLARFRGKVILPLRNLGCELFPFTIVHRCGGDEVVVSEWIRSVE